MFETRTINTWDDALRVAAVAQRQCVFRGQQQASWPIASSIERMVRHEPSRDELTMVRHFWRQAPAYLAPTLVPSDIVTWLSLMRHCGAPTRLLDFTRSPYVALFFALEDPNDVSASHALWAVDRHWCQTAVASKLAEATGCTEDQAVTQIHKDQAGIVQKLISGELAFDGVLPVEPLIMDPRQAAQQTVLLCPCNLAKTFAEKISAMRHVEGVLVKWEMSPAVRARGLEDLRAMNVTSASLFPGIEGLARSLKTLVVTEEESSRMSRLALAVLREVRSVGLDSEDQPPTVK